MKKSSFGCRFLAVLSAVFTLSASHAAPPNIVYILADDLGWKDTGFHGSTEVKTPNLDELSSTGARLNSFYVLPMCTPTRAALMTGRYPMRYGLQTLVIPSKGTYGLPTDEVTLPQVLQKAGYRTTMVGKWHLGHADQKYWPCQRGFEYHYGAVLGEIDYFTHSAHGVLDWQRDNRSVQEKGYVTELLGDDAVKVIKGHDGQKPLFLYLAFTAPHAPYQAPESYLKKFAHIADETRRNYVGQIACMDDQVGRVIAALREKNMRDNTLIVFHGDNGGTRDARMTGEGKVKTVPCDNGPLRDGKGQLYEGGTLVPAFANWPGKIASRDVSALVHVVDMLPTLATLAGADASQCKPLDGLNAWPAIAEGKPGVRDEVVYNIEPFRASIRQGQWKLVWRVVLPSSVELFDLSQDPNETKNVAEAHPEITAKLQARVQELSKQSSKPLIMDTAMTAIMEGIFGPAPIPVPGGESIIND